MRATRRDQTFPYLAAREPAGFGSQPSVGSEYRGIGGRLAGVPVVSSVHNPDHELQAWSDGADVSLMKRPCVRAFDRWTAEFGSRRLIAVSDYVRQSAHRRLKFALDDIDLLYNPIDVDLLSVRAEKSRSQLLRECCLPDDTVLLLNVGCVSPQKGLIHALRALPTITRRYPMAHLISIGETTDPAWLEQLKKEAQAAGVDAHFHILGTRRHVTDFLRACDVFVFPSLYEGLGIASIEAMAARCACVATTTGPIPEFAKGGQDAVSVPPADPDALAMAICDRLMTRSAPASPSALLGRPRWNVFSRSPRRIG